MRNTFLCLLAAFTAASPLEAQNENEGEARQAKGRVAWFVYTSLPEGLENPVSVMSGKDVSEVTLSKRSPSEPVKIPADGILRLVRPVADPTQPDKSVYFTLAQAKIPDGLSKALIILMPLDNNPEGLLFQTKVQDLSAFKGGDWLYLNMTRLKVGVDMGKTSIVINPGEVRIYGAPALTEPVNMPIRYSYLNPLKNQWQMISASTVVLHATRREICIFGWDPKFERIQKHGITFPVTR